MANSTMTSEALVRGVAISRLTPLLCFSALSSGQRHDFLAKTTGLHGLGKLDYYPAPGAAACLAMTMVMLLAGLSASFWFGE